MGQGEASKRANSWQQKGMKRVLIPLNLDDPDRRGFHRRDEVFGRNLMRCKRFEHGAGSEQADELAAAFFVVKRRMEVSALGGSIVGRWYYPPSPFASRNGVEFNEGERCRPNM